MNPETWQRTAEVFHRAVTLPPTERPEFLESALGDEPELLAEVTSLLESHDASAGFLEESAPELTELVDGEELFADPERIGPYRVIERIGAGGMGTVYLAERDDDQYKKRVAIKLIKRGMDSEQILARFRAERQILASLDHPGIARLFDGGVAEDGRPYFVLEHIDEALPIDRYCHDNELTVGKRLELFRQACDAVQYAHRKLIVHRDIKPSNLLVSRDGRVKLLDFGIAKLLDPDLAGVTQIAATHTEQRLLTPEYASPEQIRGEPLATTSDVYSLGVILYKILTGAMPYQPASQTPLALAEAICDQAPERPSTAILRRVTRSAGDVEVRPELPAGRLRGDLDNIVLMALRKEPEARYRSVDALAADLDRFLDHRPVLARSQTVAYRMQRFLERHALATTLSALAAVLLIAGLAGTAWQARTARFERDRAQAEALKAERVADVLADLFRLSAPGAEGNASTMTLREFADRAEVRVLEGLEDPPEVRSRLETVIGTLNTDLARYERSRGLLESALATQRQLYPEGHTDLATTLQRLGALRVFEQEYRQATVLLEEALAMRRGLEGDSLEVAAILAALAEPRALLQDAEGSERATLEALAIRQRLLPDDHELIGRSLGGLAVLNYGKGEYAEAARYCERALEIQRAIHGEVSQAAAHELNNLGAIYVANGDYDKALATHREALTVRTEVYGADHPYVAFSHGYLGTLSQLLGDPVAAVRHQRRALEVREAAYGRRHRLVAVSLTSLAAALAETGAADASVELFEEAASIEIDLRGESAGLAAVLVAWGQSECARGECAAALPRLRQAVDLQRDASGADHPWTASLEVELGRALIFAGDLEEADRVLGAALSTLEARLAEDHLDKAPAHLYRGDLERQRGRPDAARASYESALRILRARLPAEHRRIAEAVQRIEELA